MNNLVVLLPAYNEEKDVERLVLNWQQYKEILEEIGLSLHIMIINDGSKDRTKEIILGLMDQYDNVILEDHNGNKGLGRAVNTGFYKGLKRFGSSSYFCLMDCDNTQDPSYVFSMLEKMNQTRCDVVIASRYEGGSKVHGLAKYREMTSIMARYVYQILLGVPKVKDYTCGYRLYKGTILKRAYMKYQNQFIGENGFTCMAEVLYKLYEVGAVFAEVPFELHYDYKAGESKMHVVKTAIRSLRLCFDLRWRKHKNG
ncbi:glycosyltransferase [Lachnospiraceae bacterium KM106-2]|nr:glycosyltransferase [Lachnospiraceae bacterium KM106-2]